MEIINYFESSKQTDLIKSIAACDWGAAKFLADLLQKGTFHETLGGWGHLFLLMDGENLVSFLTLTGQDAVRDEALTPWIGFVFTVPSYRGHRYAGLLLNHAQICAAKLGYPKLYIATDHVGLYEKYGYNYLENRVDCWGDDVRVLYKDLMTQNVIGKPVTVVVDRPLGTCHPRHNDICYPVNYGYIPGVMAPDREEQDAYILGIHEPLKEFTGRVIAVIHRLNDVEDKWVVAPENAFFTKEEIMEQVAFQEQYFQTEIHMCTTGGAR